MFPIEGNEGKNGGGTKTCWIDNALVVGCVADPGVQDTSTWPKDCVE